MTKFTLASVAAMTEEELNNLCDFGCFNEAIQGYLVIAMQDTNFCRDDIEKALSGLYNAFENTSAAEARDAWRNF